MIWGYHYFILKLDTGQQVTTFNPGKIHLKKLTQSSFIHNFHFGKPQLTTINTMRLRFWVPVSMLTGSLRRVTILANVNHGASQYGR